MLSKLSKPSVLRHAAARGFSQKEAAIARTIAVAQESSIKASVTNIPEWLSSHLLSKKAPKGFERFMKDIKKKKDEPKEAQEAGKEEKETKKEEKTPKEEIEETEESEEEEDTKKKSDEDEEDSKKEKEDSNSLKAMFFNEGGDPNWQNFGILALVLGGIYYALNYSTPAKELVYMEFVNDYLTKNRVKQINIVKDKRSDVFNYRADIETDDGEKYYVTLGSVDNFLAKIDMI